MRQNNPLSNLPQQWREDLLPHIQEQIRDSRRKVIVLDDDPTGTQTVHDVPVLTEWSVETLCTELAGDLPAFYLLTNSRSLPLSRAQALNAEIGRNLTHAAESAGSDFALVSRSDSTLRGHFPGEVESLARALQVDFDAWILIPFLQEGGRYTINDIHYVAEGERLVPVGDTVYARDATFGYRASDLRQWVEEKTEGRVSAKSVASISIDDIRCGGPDRVSERLMSLPRGCICVVNAASMRDLEVFVRGLLTTEARGRRFLYRTAASFVQVRAGIAPRPLLTRADLELPEYGGALFVVGSHVPKTTEQVERLLDQPDVVGVEMDVKALFGQLRLKEIERAAREVNQGLHRRHTVVLYTGRAIVIGDNGDTSLFIGQRISESIVAAVRAVSERPRYLLAKGGITSSDVATASLDVKRATVRGQILPGVPVWQLGTESRYPGLVYIVFPGNVGAPDALTQIAGMLGSAGETDTSVASQAPDNVLSRNPDAH